MMVQSILDDKEAHLEKIRALFSKMSSQEHGGITYAMFHDKINTPAVQEYFATLGLDVWDAWSFFKLLDLDAGGSVEILDRSAQAFWAFRPCVSTTLRLESSVPTESFVDACTFCMVRAVRAADVYETTSVLRLRSRNFLKVA